VPSVVSSREKFDNKVLFHLLKMTENCCIVISEMGIEVKFFLEVKTASRLAFHAKSFSF